MFNSKCILLYDPPYHINGRLTKVDAYVGTGKNIQKSTEMFH